MNDETRIDMATAQPIDTFGDPSIEQRPSRRAWWIAGAIALVLAVGAWMYTRSGGEKALADSRADQAPTVTVITPGRGTVQGTINATRSGASCRERVYSSV